MTLVEAGAAEFAYGNTRLRARKSGLLRAEDYVALLGLDLDALLGALAATAYRADVEAALARAHGVRRLHEAVRRHLGRSLEEMRRFYDGSARELVDLLLSAWDVRNLVTLLRGQSARAPAEEVLPLIVPVGGLDEGSAREVARQPEFAAAVQLLVSWRVPTPADADALARAWPAYERSANLAALEHALTAAHLTRVAAALDQAATDAEPLRRALMEEADDRNLLVALRLRETAETDEDARLPNSREALLPSGSLAPEALAAAGAAPSREAAAGILAPPGAERQRRPLERWVQTGDLAVLQDDLERARARARARLFGTGDPLGIAVPLAYAAAKEVEARNLRVLGDGASRGVDPHVVRSQLLLP